jgi:hypothetical protein
VIGLADTTGATVASHLHLTLKLEGATKRGETKYPKDIIDPTPFMVWPNLKSAKNLPKSDGTPTKCLYGLHGRVGGSLTPEDVALIQGSRLEAVKLDRRESLTTLHALREDDPTRLIVIRLDGQFDAGPVRPDEFVNLVDDDVRRFNDAGIRHFELLSSPNLQSDGWGRSWRDGFEFGQWWLDVFDRLRSVYPEAKFGFPGLSPGEAVRGWRAEALSFMEQAEAAIGSADWLGVNCIWTDRSSMGALFAGRLYNEVRLRFPDKLLFITEFYNASERVSEVDKATEYLEFYRSLRGERGIGAAFAYALSAESGHETLVFRGEGQDRSLMMERVNQGLR